MRPQRTKRASLLIAVAAACTVTSAFVSAVAAPARSEAAASSQPPAAARPGRVVSLNLCTDQLAMLVAAPRQLVSVSYLARDPAASVLAKEARRYPVNHGQAEEIFKLRPDLIVGGTFSTRATVALLRRLGFRVELFTPATSLQGIREAILRLGRLLGRDAHARGLVAQFDRDVARLSRLPKSSKLAALYDSNSYTSGRGTLAADILALAGLRNISEQLDLTGSARLPLELLITSRPDLIVTGRRWSHAPARAHEVLSHPALRNATTEEGIADLPDKLWACGAPFTLEAVWRLHRASERLRQVRP